MKDRCRVEKYLPFGTAKGTPRTAGRSFLFLKRKVRQSRLMQKPLVLLFLLVFSLAAFGQKGKPPAFGQYPAKVEKVRAKTIDFSHSPGAGTFRTRLREALAEGVNFAGHFVVAGWGCGTGCISGGIIDARDGRVYFPKQFNDIAVWYNDSGYTEKPISYRKNSRMFVVSGISGDQEDRPGEESLWGDYYYEWKNNSLKLVRFVKRPRKLSN